MMNRLNKLAEEWELTVLAVVAGALLVFALFRFVTGPASGLNGRSVARRHSADDLGANELDLSFLDGEIQAISFASDNAFTFSLPQPKPEPRVQPKVQPKPEPEPEPKPQPKPDPKPQPKPEPKPPPPPKTAKIVYQGFLTSTTAKRLAVVRIPDEGNAVRYLALDESWNGWKVVEFAKDGLVLEDSSGKRATVGVGEMEEVVIE